MQTPSSTSRLTAEQASERLFVGVFPAGISYADKGREEHGDYASLAFLSFDKLELTLEKNCPEPFRNLITSDAADIQGRRGQEYPVSASGQTIRLGYALK